MKNPTLTGTKPMVSLSQIRTRTMSRNPVRRSELVDALRNSLGVVNEALPPNLGHSNVMRAAAFEQVLSTILKYEYEDDRAEEGMRTEKKWIP